MACPAPLPHSPAGCESRPPLPPASHPQTAAGKPPTPVYVGITTSAITISTHTEIIQGWREVPERISKALSAGQRAGPLKSEPGRKPGENERGTTPYLTVHILEKCQVPIPNRSNAAPIITSVGAASPVQISNDLAP